MKTPDAAHIHRWVDKALLHEPSLKVCECGATMTDREYRDAPVAASAQDVSEIACTCAGLHGGSNRCPIHPKTHRPRLLDLFCGAGGCAKGYQLAGFDVTGVDIHPQPNYPFEFVQEDALEVLRNPEGWLYTRRGDLYFDAIHASPPCQRWAAITVKGRDNHPDLITPLRPLLEATSLPWVIENVPAAPLRDPVMVCGGALGCVSGDLQLHRHRMFEASFPIVGTPCVTVRPQTVSVVGHGSPTGNRGTLGRNPTIAEKREAMGIDWCNRDELSEAVPPAYTEWIGNQLLEQVRNHGKVAA